MDILGFIDFLNSSNFVDFVYDIIWSFRLIRDGSIVLVLLPGLIFLN